MLHLESNKTFIRIEQNKFTEFQKNKKNFLIESKSPFEVQFCLRR